MKGFSKLGWGALALLGAFCLGTIALRAANRSTRCGSWSRRSPSTSSPTASTACSSPTRCCGSTPRARRPPWRHNDGLDYVPTNKHVLFGHHFAAIAGAGPLVGPVLAAQMGYLPGTLWILAGVVLAGAVQDFMVLFISTRRDGRSLGDMIRAGDGRGARR